MSTLLGMSGLEVAGQGRLCNRPQVGWDVDESGNNLCDKELWASTAGLATLGPLLGVEYVYEFTDSTVALGAMTRLTPTTERMQQLVRQRLALAERWRWRLAARRVSSKNNLWADLASRGQAVEVAAQAAALGLRVRWLQPQWE